MSPSHRNAKLILSKFIVPCFLALVFVILAYQIGNEIFHIQRLSSDVHDYQIQLNEKKLHEIELRREKVVMGMDDFKSAIEKANGANLDEGEIRIVIK